MLGFGYYTFHKVSLRVPEPAFPHQSSRNIQGVLELCLMVSLCAFFCAYAVQDNVITGLLPETSYSVVLAAYTTKGDGAHSKAKLVTTKGAGECGKTFGSLYGFD